LGFFFPLPFSAAAFYEVTVHCFDSNLIPTTLAAKTKRTESHFSPGESHGKMRSAEKE